MASTNRREYLQELEKLERLIEREFIQFVRSASGRVSVVILEGGVREQDVEVILKNLAITSAAMGGTTEIIRSGFLAGGKFEAPAARIQFDIRNPRAEAWIREHSSQFVTRIVESQREAIRVTLRAGLELGQNPRRTALDIVGRIGPTGRRAGGIVGLTEQQAQFVANARRELLSGDPSQMVNYFTRARRDRRFDAIVRRAINEGRPVSLADVDRIVGRYSDRLLMLRGESIGRTESTAAFNAGRDEAAEQAIEDGVIRRDLTIGIWDATGDARTRPDHASMHGQTQPAGVPFRSPSGALLLHPGDSSLGAGAADVANCRCYKRIRYDFIGEVARYG